MPLCDLFIFVLPTLFSEISTLKLEKSTLRPPAGRQYGMSISQQPLNRSLPNFQQLLLMANEGKVESFSSFAYG